MFCLSPHNLVTAYGYVLQRLSYLLSHTVFKVFITILAACFKIMTEFILTNPL